MVKSVLVINPEGSRTKKNLAVFKGFLQFFLSFSQFGPSLHGFLEFPRFVQVFHVFAEFLQDFPKC